jgi:hypothetical protein
VLEGDHLSIDYNQDINGFWHTRSVWRGVHDNKENLTRFASWTRLDNNSAPKWNDLPIDASFLYDPEVPVFNVEMIGDVIDSGSDISGSSYTFSSSFTNGSLTR